jgi:hypothetical protein
MEIAKPGDFAPHYLEAKKKLEEAHKLLIAGDYQNALIPLTEAIVELKAMRSSVVGRE